MYYFKHIGTATQLETRNVSAINPPETMISITEDEYNTLAAEMAASETTDDTPTYDDLTTALNDLGVSTE